MDTSFNPGRQSMSADEYGDAIRELHQHAQTTGSSQSLIDQEFLLTIDYRLGRDFPAERRLLLLDAQRSAHAEMKKLTRKFFLARFAPRKHARRINELNSRLMMVFSTILSPEEFEMFTGTTHPFKNQSIVIPENIPAH